MTTDDETVVLPAAPAAEREVGPYRPAEPDHGAGRWTRVLTGVREDVLDWVPEERARYTALGAIIVNTGLLAALSMFAALDNLVDAPWPALVPICLFWAFVIIMVDRWLIASTHGKIGGNRFWVFVPRLLLSILIGAVIAEPLLLWIFHPSIHQEVLDQRQRDRGTYAEQLARCNPPSGEVDTSPACKPYRVTVSTPSPAALQDQLNQDTAQRATLKAQLDQINGTLKTMDDLSRDECNGAPGRGLTGRRGQGPNCIRDRQEADQFRADNHPDALQTKIQALDQTITGLNDQIKTATDAYSRDRATAIQDQVAVKQQHEGTIGLLDEDAALGRLASGSILVRAAEWLLRLLLVAMDCLPVLTKMLGGSTRYDAQVNEQTALGARLHDRDLSTHEREQDQQQRRRTEKLEQADQAARAARQANQRVQIDALAAKLYRGPGGPMTDAAGIRHRASVRPPRSPANSTIYRVNGESQRTIPLP